MTLKNRSESEDKCCSTSNPRRLQVPPHPDSQNKTTFSIILNNSRQQGQYSSGCLERVLSVCRVPHSSSTSSALSVQDTLERPATRALRWHARICCWGCVPSKAAEDAVRKLRKCGSTPFIFRHCCTVTQPNQSPELLWEYGPQQQQ